MQGLWIVGIGVALLAAAPAGRTAAQPADVMAQLQTAFAAGDAHLLLDEASDRVEIALMEGSKLYSRAQATYVIQDFFRRYPPERFTLLQESRKESSWFAVGRYAYRRSTQSFQVYVRYRFKGERWELREIRIDQRR